MVSLEPKPNQPRERELVLPGVTALPGLVWAADGQGWFVSVDTTVGNQLLMYTWMADSIRWETSTAGPCHLRMGAGWHS